jgi:hypothetical protein
MIGLANTNLLSRTIAQVYDPARTSVSFSNNDRNVFGQTGTVFVYLRDEDGNPLRNSSEPTATTTHGNLSAFTRTNQGWQATYSSSTVGTADIEVFYEGVSISTRTITYTASGRFLLADISSSWPGNTTRSYRTFNIDPIYQGYTAKVQMVFRVRNTGTSTTGIHASVYTRIADNRSGLTNQTSGDFTKTNANYESSSWISTNNMTDIPMVETGNKYAFYKQSTNLPAVVQTATTVSYPSGIYNTFEGWAGLLTDETTLGSNITIQYYYKNYLTSADGGAYIYLHITG